MPTKTLPYKTRTRRRLRERIAQIRFHRRQLFYTCPECERVFTAAGLSRHTCRADYGQKKRLGRAQAMMLIYPVPVQAELDALQGRLAALKGGRPQ